MSHNKSHARVIGTLFIVGAILAIAGLTIHPPESTDSAVWMGIVADHHGAWVGAHMLVTVGHLLMLVAAALLLTGPDGAARPTIVRTGLTMWIVAGIIVTPLFFIEAGPIAHAASIGDLAAFEQWDAMANVLVPMLMPLVVGFALYAIGAIRGLTPELPRWAGALGLTFALVTAGGAIASARGLAALDVIQLALSGYYAFLAFNGVQLWRVGRASGSTGDATVAPSA